MGLSTWVEMHIASRGSNSVLLVEDKISSQGIRDKEFFCKGIYSLDGFMRMFSVLAPFSDWEFILSILSELDFSARVTGSIINGSIYLDQDLFQPFTSRLQYEDWLAELDRCPVYLARISPALDKKATTMFSLTNYSWKFEYESEATFKANTHPFYLKGNLTQPEFEALRAYWLERGWNFNPCTALSLVL